MKQKYQVLIGMGSVTALFCTILMAGYISDYTSHGYIHPRSGGGLVVYGSDAIFIMVSIGSVGIFSIFIGIYGAWKYKKTTGISYFKEVREQEEEYRNEVECTNYASYFDYKVLFSFCLKVLLYGALVYTIFFYTAQNF